MRGTNKLPSVADAARGVSPSLQTRRSSSTPRTGAPYEVLYCVSEGYKRFCKKYEAKVPLEGLQANQILRVRFNEQGNLEPVSGREPWSFSIEADGVMPIFCIASVIPE